MSLLLLGSGPSGPIDSGPDVTAPELQSATIDGDALVLTFSERVTSPDWDAAIELDGSTFGPATCTYVSGDGTRTLTLTASEVAVEDEVVTLTVAGTVTDLAENELPPTADFAVTNLTTATADLTGQPIGLLLALTYAA